MEAGLVELQQQLAQLQQRGGRGAEVEGWVSSLCAAIVPRGMGVALLSDYIACCLGV